MQGGGPQNHVPPREFPSGNMTRGEFHRGPPSGGMGFEIGGIMIPPIEIFQIAFIVLYTIQSRIMSKNSQVRNR